MKVIRGNVEVSDTQSSQSPCDRNKEKRTSNKRNGKKVTSRRIILVGSAILILVTAALVECCGWKAEIFGCIDFIFLLFCELLVQIVQAKEKKYEKRCLDKSIDDRWTRQVDMIKRCWKTLWWSLSNSPVLLFLLLLGISLLAGSFMGMKHIYARSYYSVSQAIEMFIKYETKDEQMKIKEKKQKEDIANSSSGRKIWANQDNATKDVIENITVLDDELKEVVNLSTADREELFYLSGDYKINDWKNQKEINDTVLRRIRDEIRKERENIFDSTKSDEGAPQPVCDSTSQLSEMERTVETLEKKKYILEERGNIFSIYPKASLAKLIANDNQDIALIFYYGKGRKKTILYYYGQSIKYRHQTVSFKGMGDNGIKNRVNEIRKSYKDLEIIFAKKPKICYYAKKLRKAYQYVADQY